MHLPARPAGHDKEAALCWSAAFSVGVNYSLTILASSALNETAG
jgi:hypothetical protein